MSESISTLHSLWAGCRGGSWVRLLGGATVGAGGEARAEGRLGIPVCVRVFDGGQLLLLLMMLCVFGCCAGACTIVFPPVSPHNRETRGQGRAGQPTAKSVGRLGWMCLFHAAQTGVCHNARAAPE